MIPEQPVSGHAPPTPSQRFTRRPLMLERHARANKPLLGTAGVRSHAHDGSMEEKMKKVRNTIQHYQGIR